MRPTRSRGPWQEGWGKRYWSLVGKVLLSCHWKDCQKKSTDIFLGTGKVDLSQIIIWQPWKEIYPRRQNWITIFVTITNFETWFSAKEIEESWKVWKPEDLKAISFSLNQISNTRAIQVIRYNHFSDKWESTFLIKPNLAVHFQMH